MTEPSAPLPDAPLNFDHAEYADPANTPAGVRCSHCSRDILDNYFTVGRTVFCKSCKALIEASLKAGSPAKRSIVALVAGIVACLVGAGIYYAVAAITGYELGLVAIVVGLLVGAAVRWGADRRGGWFYQTMAILLTYVSIALSHSVFAVRSILDHEKNAAAVKNAAGHPTPSTSTATQSTTVDADEPRVLRGKSGPVKTIITLVVAASIFLALPVLVGISSPISFLILAIALWEAWKLNKRLIITIAGPFAVSPNPPTDSGAAPPPTPA